MPTTIGYHFVKSTHGTWLPGDERGHWSEAWDEQIGFIEPHMLHAGDPMRLRMARERIKHPEVRLTPKMIQVVEQTIARCVAESPCSIIAASIERTHSAPAASVHDEGYSQPPVYVAMRVRCGVRGSGFNSSSTSRTGATPSNTSNDTMSGGLDPRPYAFLR
ncbi:MAG TPA: hypothetical protein VGR35_09205 [Tepidisphaeraceae bacterium]|nr:hypothetical protein [Tepidisphaeraceae bacterium]